MMRHCTPANAVLFLILCLLLASVLPNREYTSPLIPGAEALTPCRCFFGKVTQEKPTCECACATEYMSPDCLFKATDFPRIFVYVNKSIERFVSDRFLEAVIANVKAPGTSLVQTTNVSKFDAIEVLITMPGYAAYRFLDSVGYQDQWVQYENIVSAYPVWPRGPVDTVYDIIIYENGNIVLGAWGLAWLLAVVVLVLILTVFEACCCFTTNNEENCEEMDTADKYRKNMEDAMASHQKGAQDGYRTPPEGGKQAA